MKKSIALCTLAVLVLALAVGGGLALRQRRQTELATIQPPEPAPWAVYVSTVERGRATRGFPSLALLKGENEVAISPRLGGVILKLAPRAGQRVERGDLLARIDTEELQNQLASLQAQRLGAVSYAQRKARDANRAEELLKSKSLSESQVDEQRATARSAKEQVRSLENQIAAARTRLGYAKITAPFAGVISDRLADPGDLAAVGKPIFRLVATDAGRLEVRLPAEILERVKPGSEVVLSHSGEVLNLHAARVFPSLDQRSLGRLEVDLPALPFDASPGALLRARVVTEAVEDTLIVQANTLLPGKGQSSRVLRLTNDNPPRLESVAVSIRLRAREGVAVAGDLRAGDRLVTAHESTLLKLRPGDAVLPEGPHR